MVINKKVLFHSQLAFLSTNREIVTWRGSVLRNNRFLLVVSTWKRIMTGVIDNT
jgi:hypothetical protein